MEAQDLAGVDAVDEPRRLADVHLLAELAVHEGRLEVHVVHLPFELSGDGEQEAHRVQARDHSKNLVEVNPRPLHISFGDEPGLVLQDVAGSITLQLVHPLDSDRFLPRRKIGERPSMVRLDQVVLIAHRLQPRLVAFSLRERLGLAGGSEEQPLRPPRVLCINQVEDGAIADGIARVNPCVQAFFSSVT
jgi:hypothetical protein